MTHACARPLCAYDVELLVIAKNCGYRICEVPIRWINAAGSKVSFGSYLEVFGEVWRIRRRLKAGRYDLEKPKNQPKPHTAAQKRISNVE